MKENLCSTLAPIITVAATDGFKSLELKSGSLFLDLFFLVANSFGKIQTMA